MATKKLETPDEVLTSADIHKLGLSMTEYEMIRSTHKQYGACSVYASHLNRGRVVEDPDEVAKSLINKGFFVDTRTKPSKTKIAAAVKTMAKCLDAAKKLLPAYSTADKTPEAWPTIWERYEAARRVVLNRNGGTLTVRLSEKALKFIHDVKVQANRAAINLNANVKLVK